MDGDPSRTFDQVEAAAEVLRRVWEVDLVQLDSGPVRIDLQAAPRGRCVVYRSRTNRRLIASGRRSPDQVTITPITASSAGGRYRGRELEPGTVLVLDPGGEVFQQMPAGHGQSAISIPIELWDRVTRAESGEEDLSLRRPGWKVARPTRAAFDRLNRAFASVLSRPASGSDPPGADVRLVELALETITARDADNLEIPSAVRRRQIARRAEELIRSNLSRPPTVIDLCEATGVSRRTLFYAFEELFGVPPARYAKVLRLHAARRAIIADRHRPCVQRTARALGFAHEGQFALDYARVFGESPSETRLAVER